jgi:cytochrome c peroxidase
MKFLQQSRARRCALPLALLFLAAGSALAGKPDADPLTSADATGTVRTYTASGDLDTTNPFFQVLGTNGRSCFTCHRPETAWSITPASVRARFDSSAGTDPVFRTNDGSNSPQADVSTVDARRRAYSMLLNKALIRVGLPIRAGFEFTLDAVDDPYGFASAGELSLFRRVLPATNLRFLTAVMWDGRETHASFNPPMDAGAAMDDLVASFKSQATNATLGHAQAVAAPSDAQLRQIIGFELGLSTAQASDSNAGSLSDDDATGGPRILASLDFHVGINDVLGADPTLAAFSPASMRLFDGWLPAHGNADGAPRSAIARGEQLFNSKPIAISGVGGLNDVLGLPVIAGTCTTCHDSPNVGNHSVALPINIGTADASRRTPDMPLYTLRNIATGALVQTTDPGRALITGKWADVGKFKGPVLRGLAARPPYFHNGMAATLGDAVDFYDTRFNIGFTAQEKKDLVAFLNAL